MRRPFRFRLLAVFRPTALISLVLGWSGLAHSALAPYSPDPQTAHLWQFDETIAATNCADSVTGGVLLTAVRNGATLGNVSYPGFGNAASTYDAGPLATLSANPNGVPGRDAYVAPLPLVDGTGDNSTLKFTGTNGAFTLEALLRVDFNPTNQAVAPDTGRSMQIISADAEELTRLFQFRMVWSGVNDATPEIHFINIGTPIQTLTAMLPVTGSNALTTSNWYHLAVTYNGLSNTADNLKFYWTRLETNRTRADLLASRWMTNHLPAGSGDWAIGNDGRSVGGSDQNWVGLIDEVRLSTVAREANEFVFRGVVVAGASSVDGTNAAENTLDGDLGTRWSALGDGQWIAYDLGRVELVSGVRIAFYLGNARTNTFDIQASTDKVTWSNILTAATSTGNSLALEPFDVTDVLARYVRIVGHGNSESLWNSYTEVEIQSVPLGDSEPDGLPDAWEFQFFGGLTQGPGDNPDGDAYSNLQEYQAGSNPTNTLSVPGDIDADGLPDAWERQYFGSLSQTGAGDPDGDGFSNAAELAAGTSPANPASAPGDSDSDRLQDDWELTHFGSLLQSGTDDPDEDWSDNLQEFLGGTNPRDPNSRPPGPRVRLIPVEDGDPATSEYGYSGGINTAAFIRSSVQTFGDQQFITYYGRHQTDPAHASNNKLWVGRRKVGAQQWEVFRTAFTANNITDGHDCISFGIDGLGYMHISWGMHADAYHYARSLTPVTGTNIIAFGPDGTMTGKENAVTYPQFVRLPNGDLLYLFREGGSGNGDLFLNRYSIAAKSWTNVHLSGTNQLAFIKGTGWTPNYNAYWQQPCIDAAGRLFLTWTWRYNTDSPAGESGYQTNHDYDYAWSPDGGVTWKRSTGVNYVLPINERGENGNTNSIAEKILSIPEGSSLMNQSGMCLDRQGKPVLANWWAPGALTNDHRRQYQVAFPGNSGWEVRQVSFRTIDSPANKVPESALGDMGRPTIVSDKEDRLIVIYRDNEGLNGLTVVHSLPRALDPDRLYWTQFDLTKDTLGGFDAPNVDLTRWEQDNVLQVYYQPVNGQGFIASNTASPVSVLEWDAAAYFKPRPHLQLNHTNSAASLRWPGQPGWRYTVQSSQNLTNWTDVTTGMGTNGWMTWELPSLPADRTFWRLQLREGGF